VEICLLQFDLRVVGFLPGGPSFRLAGSTLYAIE
jgi:hypothetical protein